MFQCILCFLLSLIFLYYVISVVDTYNIIPHFLILSKSVVDTFADGNIRGNILCCFWNKRVCLDRFPILFFMHLIFWMMKHYDCYSLPSCPLGWSLLSFFFLRSLLSFHVWYTTLNILFKMRSHCLVQHCYLNIMLWMFYYILFLSWTY